MEKALRHNSLLMACVGIAAFVVLGAAVETSSPVQESAPQWPLSTIATSTSGGDVSLGPPLAQYIEIVNSCGPYFDGGPCVNMRSGPGTNYPVVIKLRTGIVLKVVSSTIVDGRTWYKVGFDGEIHYPERITSDWYVSADYVRSFSDVGPSEIASEMNTSSAKRIVIDRAKEMLYAYDGDVLFMQQAISVGLELTPTPRGAFWVTRKSPDSYMQGPVPGVSDQYYDLPGVPWDLYFTTEGAAIHGTYWHNHFGAPWSHGCVNLPADQAKILYEWADLGTPVTVQN